MRRAPLALAAAALAAVLAVEAAHAAQQSATRINAIGLVDYTRKPTFKVGDYVRYDVTENDTRGTSDHYTVTLVIAGEEDWWGEPCFWLETWAEYPNQPSSLAASLMSYGIFDDTLATDHVQLFRRKLILGFDDDGNPIETVAKPADNLRTLREPPRRRATVAIDTLPPDTVVSPAGTFHVLRIHEQTGLGGTETRGDSTIYTEARQNVIRYETLDVPITHYAREDYDNTDGRRAWVVGYTADSAPLRLRDHTVGVARVIAYGHGMHGRVLPSDRQHSIAELQAIQARAAAAKGRATARAAHPR